jgi:phage/plasmid-associated DNA primase
MMRARRDLLAHANPLKGFIDECCDVDPKSKVTLQSFYDAYRQWATRSGYTMTQVKSTVKRNLEHQGYVITRRNAGITVIGLKLRLS